MDRDREVKHEETEKKTTTTDKPAQPVREVVEEKTEKTTVKDD